MDTDPNSFRVFVENPRTGTVERFVYPSEFDELLLPSLMNCLAFDPEQERRADANFVSRYNRTKDDFDYFVQRLMGVEMDNEMAPESGKVWLPFINGRREDWTFICQNNRIVTKKDLVVWKFVPWEEAQHSTAEFGRS